MMKQYVLLILLAGFGLISCDNEPDPDPLPGAIRSYCTLYNFLTEPVHVNWEVDEINVEGQHIYGLIVLGGVLLEEETEEISFVVKNAASGEIIESVLIKMTEGHYYQVVIFGTLENPVFLHQEVDSSPPESGNVRVQYLHATESLDSLDVYLGGTTPDKRVISGIDYTELSEYSEVSDYDNRASVIITPHDTIFNPGSELISYKYNDQIQVNNNYLTVIAPSGSSPGSPLALWLYAQPID
jgi:hypothetical protein